MTSRRWIAPLMRPRLTAQGHRALLLFRRIRRGADEKQRADRQVLVNQRPVDAIPGRREFRPAPFRERCTGEALGTVFPWNRDRPGSVVTISVSGVVSMAFAKTGFVLLCTMPSEASPLSNKRSGRNAQR